LVNRITPVTWHGKPKEKLSRPGSFVPCRIVSLLWLIKRATYPKAEKTHGTMEYLAKTRFIIEDGI
jgi:hypothetical protein